MDKEKADALEALRAAEEERQRIARLPAVPTHNLISANVYYENNYTAGNCTWYAASRKNVPPSMGNATNWSFGLANAGWTVSNNPIPGAIGISHAGSMGHVVIVESVTGTGVLISEMNYQGLGVIDTRLAPVAEFVYAYH